MPDVCVQYVGVKGHVFKSHLINLAKSGYWSAYLQSDNFVIDINCRLRCIPNIPQMSSVYPNYIYYSLMLLLLNAPVYVMGRKMDTPCGF